MTQDDDTRERAAGERPDVSGESAVPRSGLRRFPPVRDVRTAIFGAESPASPALKKRSRPTFALRIVYAGRVHSSNDSRAHNGVSRTKEATVKMSIPTNVATVLILAGATLGFGTMPAGAEESEWNRGGLSIGPRFAAINPNDGTSQPFGGAQARLPLGDVLAIEASADARRNMSDGNAKIWTVPVQLSALIYLIPKGPISPFVLGGAGWYYTVTQSSDRLKDSQHRFGLHAGGGLQWWLNRGLSIDGTYRYLWIEQLESKDAAFRDKKFDDSGHMFTVGVNFHF